MTPASRRTWSLLRSFRRLAFVGLAATAACGPASPGSHASDGVGNGGSIVVDGQTYSLADLHFKPFAGELFALDDTMRAAMQDAKVLFGLRGFDKSFAFFEDHVLAETVVYKFVAALPPGCDDEPLPLPEGTEARVFACTKGALTYIVPKDFVRLSPRERVAALIHERLHAFAPNQPHEIISPFVAGWLRFQGLVDRRFSRDPLSADDLAFLRLWRVNAQQLGLMDLHVKPVIHPNGGGQCFPNTYGLGEQHCKSIPADVHVNVLSLVIDRPVTTWGHGAAFLDTTVRGGQYGDGIEVRGYELSSTEVLDRARLVTENASQWDNDAATFPSRGRRIEFHSLRGPVTLKESSFEGAIATTEPLTIEDSRLQILDRFRPCHLRGGRIVRSELILPSGSCSWEGAVLDLEDAHVKAPKSRFEGMVAIHGATVTAQALTLSRARFVGGAYEARLGSVAAQDVEVRDNTVKARNITYPPADVPVAQCHVDAPDADVSLGPDCPVR